MDPRRPAGRRRRSVGRTLTRSPRRRDDPPRSTPDRPWAPVPPHFWRARRRAAVPSSTRTSPSAGRPAVDWPTARRRRFWPPARRPTAPRNAPSVCLARRRPPAARWPGGLAGVQPLRGAFAARVPGLDVQGCVRDRQARSSRTMMPRVANGPRAARARWAACSPASGGPSLGIVRCGPGHSHPALSWLSDI
jgi:hypothetical protein